LLTWNFFTRGLIIFDNLKGDHEIVKRGPNNSSTIIWSNSQEGPRNAKGGKCEGLKSHV
jgi:hypothetical protein